MNPRSLTILDAGMGKTLSMKGVEIPPTIWSANALLVAPEVVTEVHRENIETGATLITTNSYGIILADLAKVGIEDRYDELNRLAGHLARVAADAAPHPVAVAASLPPQNGSYRPDLVLDRAIIEPLYRRQAQLLAPYADVLLCETMSSGAEALAAASACAGLGKPVFIGLTLDDETPATLRSGESLESVLASLRALPAPPSAVLANCCLPERVSDAMPILASAGFAYCGGYANAFTRVPQDWLLDGDKENDGRLTLREDLSPQRYAEFSADWVAKGANIVGGCCGTTASHTAAISQLLTE